VNRAVPVPGALLLLLAAICAPSGNVLAESRTFSLPQAVEHALVHNGELRALRTEKEVARAGLERAVLLPNPTLELSGDTGALTGSSGENTVSVGLSQEFLTGGKRAKRRAVAEQETEAVHHQIVDRERLLTLEVKSTLSELMLAQKRRELAEHAVDLNGKLLEITRERLTAGDIPELEVNLARVEVARSEGRKIEAERELYPLLARLRTLLGVPAGEDVTVEGLPDRRPLGITLGELKHLALENRPDLKSLEASRVRGEAGVALAEAERIPNVTLGLGYTHERSLDATGTAEEKTRDNFLGAKISIPLPVFDRNQAGIREAQAKRRSAESRLEFARMSIEREIEGDHARLAAAEKALDLYTSGILPQLEENLKLVQEAYQLGEVGILAVIEEQKKYIEVNDGYLVALADRQTALARLEASVGVDFQNKTSGGAQ